MKNKQERISRLENAVSNDGDKDLTELLQILSTDEGFYEVYRRIWSDPSWQAREQTRNAERKDLNAPPYGSERLV